jgi:hypothetical protein
MVPVPAQFLTGSVVLSSNSESLSKTFPAAFVAPPVLFAHATGGTAADVYTSVVSVTATGFIVRFSAPTPAGATLQWLAVSQSE